jgi:transcriptional regulator with XRE-family HTH domain
MNLTQMHERLRLELLRRIERGTLSVSLLARQTGFGQSHLSNFLRERRNLSLEAMDRILAAQRLTAADLLPTLARTSLAPPSEEFGMVPLVSHSTALFEPVIRPSAVQSMLHFPAELLTSIHWRKSTLRRSWQRFVAVRIPEEDAPAMDPLVLANAAVLIDRHYRSFVPYRPNRQNVYAVRCDAHLLLRYADFTANRLVLRPHSAAFQVELLEVEPGEEPEDLLVGRVALILNEA